MTLDDNQRLFGKLALVAVGMFGFGYALVPFYEQICAAWGINSLGQVREAPTSTQVDRNRLVTVEFDSNAHGLPWRF
jgi:cytochrome c oxidase assembly protein subunit 11